MPALLDKARKDTKLPIATCKTNVRRAIRESDWLHADHALKTIAIAVPAAYASGAACIYFSSGRSIIGPYPQGWRMRPTAAAPGIANAVELSGLRVQMVGQEHTRTQKMQYAA